MKARNSLKTSCEVGEAFHLIQIDNFARNRMKCAKILTEINLALFNRLGNGYYSSRDWFNRDKAKTIITEYVSRLSYDEQVQLAAHLKNLGIPTGVWMPHIADVVFRFIPE